MGPDFRLDGQAAVVSGASRGIGRSIALALAGAGAGVVLLGREQSTLDEVAREIESHGGDALPLVADINQADQALHVAEVAREQFSQLHVLVNNAATSPFARLAQELSVEDWDRVMDVNVRGTFALIKAIGTHMISRGYGRIINVTSVLSETGISRSIPYAPSKAALRSLTQCLAADWASHGITVNALAPGFIETEMNANGRKDKAFYEAVRGRIAQGRWGQPDDLAGPALFLASPAARYVTGTTVVVDGGFSNTWAYRI